MNVGVDENIFPLKDKGKGGDFRNSHKIYSDKLNSLRTVMSRQRDEFGTRYYSAQGDRIILEVTQMGNGREYSYPQLRWMIQPKGAKKRLIITSSIVDTFEKANSATKQLVKEIAKLKLTTHYLDFVQAEKERVIINSRAKAIRKMLVSLDEILKAQNFEQYVSQALALDKQESQPQLFD